MKVRLGNHVLVLLFKYIQESIGGRRTFNIIVFIPVQHLPGVKACKDVFSLIFMINWIWRKNLLIVTLLH